MAAPELRRARIALTQAAGMTLADAIGDAQGGPRMSAGAVLTEADLAELARRGVTQCVVWAGPSPEPAAARLAYLFRHHGAGASAAALQRLLATYRERESP